MPRCRLLLLPIMILALLLPCLTPEYAPDTASPAPPATTATAAASTAASYWLPPLQIAPTPRVRLMTEGGTLELDAEEYLIGVVAAEMPASFSAEALSAQAVAARSYLLSHSADYGRPRHTEADVCIESAHCQAYLSEAELRQRWGAEYEARYAKIAAAVAQTRGLVLWYAGAIAEAPFCSACGGSSEAAAELWGGTRDYLIAAECRWCAHAPRYRQTEVLPLSEAAAALCCTESELLTMQLVAESSGGRVASLSIGGSSYSGAELRQRLKLPSAAFSWLIAGDELRIYCRGYGHGVGLCQYGADGMAAEGAHFTAILAHYYPGTRLMQLY